MRLIAMRKIQAIAGAAVLLAFASSVQAREFGGYECTEGCTGHKAGYDWAEQHDVTDETACEQILVDSPNRTSLYEGCMTFVTDPLRGSDEDDDGDDIEAQM